MMDTGHFSTSGTTSYERFRPRMYHPRMSIFWWVKKRAYVLFIIRELTSLFVAAYAILLMVKLYALLQGPGAWESLQNFFATPFSIGLHLLILVFVLFHSITWFRLAPTAMVIRFRNKQLPGSLIIALNVVMWIVFSAAILLLVLYL